MDYTRYRYDGLYDVVEVILIIVSSIAATEADFDFARPDITGLQRQRQSRLQNVPLCSDCTPSRPESLTDDG